MTEFIIHRVNSINELSSIPIKYGTEIDIRAYGDKLILNHEPFQSGDSLEEYLSSYRHGLLVLNIKEAGIETEVIRLVKEAGIERYFLLDCEFPYIYRASREGVKDIAMRYSEDEAMETVLNYTGKVDWVWVDTNTILPLDKNIIVHLSTFKSCLVCPERWGREGDIESYANKLKKFSFMPDAIMTSFNCVKMWERFLS